MLWLAILALGVLAAAAGAGTGRRRRPLVEEEPDGDLGEEPRDGMISVPIVPMRPPDLFRRVEAARRVLPVSDLAGYRPGAVPGTYGVRTFGYPRSPVDAAWNLRDRDLGAVVTDVLLGRPTRIGDRQDAYGRWVPVAVEYRGRFVQHLDSWGVYDARAGQALAEALLSWRGIGPRYDAELEAGAAVLHGISRIAFVHARDPANLEAIRAEVAEQQARVQEKVEDTELTPIGIATAWVEGMADILSEGWEALTGGLESRGGYTNARIVLDPTPEQAEAYARGMFDLVGGA